MARVISKTVIPIGITRSRIGNAPAGSRTLPRGEGACYCIWVQGIYDLRSISPKVSADVAGYEIRINRRAVPAPQALAIDQQPAHAVLAHVGHVIGSDEYFTSQAVGVAVQVHSSAFASGPPGHLNSDSPIRWNSSAGVIFDGSGGSIGGACEMPFNIGDTLTKREVRSAGRDSQKPRPYLCLLRAAEPCPVPPSVRMALEATPAVHQFCGVCVWRRAPIGRAI
jgi:hypothetical protein